MRIWLKSLEQQDRKIIGEDIKAVQMKWPQGLPLVGPLGFGLWEVRSDLDNRIARVIFTFKEGNIMLLHGFIKKTQKTPPSDMELAKKRSKNI